MAKYLIHRVETIHYDKTYTREELIEMGCPQEAFEDGDLTADFRDEVFYNDALRDALTEDTERHADVQGSVYTIKEIA